MKLARGLTSCAHVRAGSRTRLCGALGEHRLQRTQCGRERLAVTRHRTHPATPAPKAGTHTLHDRFHAGQRRYRRTRRAHALPFCSGWGQSARPRPEQAAGAAAAGPSATGGGRAASASSSKGGVGGCEASPRLRAETLDGGAHQVGTLDEGVLVLCHRPDGWGLEVRFRRWRRGGGVVLRDEAAR